MAEPLRLTDEQWEDINRVFGWLLRDEADFLLGLCESPWLEIGSHRGRSTKVLAMKGPGVCIDDFSGTPDDSGPRYEVVDEFRENTKDLPVTLIYSDFRTAVPLKQEFRFLYLDADHSYDATKEAWDIYTPLLVKGGIVALHDAAGGHYPGVEKFVEKITWEKVGGVERILAWRAG